MQATIAHNPMKLIKNNIDFGRKFPKEVIPYLLKAAENADNALRNDIENQLVKIGENGIPVLVKAFGTSSNSVRGLISMTLIRIGRLSIEPLRQAYHNTEFGWAVDYIINEIEGTRKPLKAGFKLNELQEALVG